MKLLSVRRWLRSVTAGVPLKKVVPNDEIQAKKLFYSHLGEEFFGVSEHGLNE